MSSKRISCGSDLGRRCPELPDIVADAKASEKGLRAMAITNAEIIFKESQNLLQQGILKATGRMFVQELPDGTKVEVPEAEPIHTYNGWKELGFQVKKGEHAKAQFSIWKYTGKKDEETGEWKIGHCFQKKAFWFTFDQVEKVG